MSGFVISLCEYSLYPWTSTRTSRLAARCITRNAAKPRPVSATRILVPTDDERKRRSEDITRDCARKNGGRSAGYSGGGRKPILSPTSAAAPGAGLLAGPVPDII